MDEHAAVQGSPRPLPKWPVIARGRRAVYLRASGPKSSKSVFVSMAKTNNVENAEMMKYQTIIREIPAIRVAALAHRGDYNQIATTFQQLAAIAASMNLFGPSTRSFAIYYDDPSATPQNALRSDACLTVPEGWSPSDRLELREIRAGRYVVALHVGPYAELAHAYKWLYGTWLVQSGEELADRPIVEEYLNDARTVPPNDLKTEIWLPLR